MLGDAYIAGRSTAADFPRAASPTNGFQTVCSSCQELPPATDAFVLALQESATAAPSLSFTSLNMNFGPQPVGAQNIPPLFSALINTGDAPLNVSSIAVSGPSSSSFALVGTDPCIGTPMQPRATCSFEVSFSPASVGPAEAFVTVTDDAPGSPHVLSVVGIGSGPLAVPSPTSISFANQPQGSISPAKVVTIFNQGNQPLQVANLAPAGPDKAQFAVQSNTCGSNGVPGGASCSLNVVFAPLGIGPYQAEIDVIDNSGGLTGAKQVIALTGTGVVAAPIANVSPAALTFGTLAVGTTSGPQAITLRNLGSAALTLSQVKFTGPDAPSFAISPSNTTCPTGGGTVAIGSVCIIEIDFAPQTSGSKSATVNFIDNAAGSPQSISLSAMAIAPTLQISPTAINFAPQSVGTASPSQPITLSNSGTSPVTINGFSVNGANAGDFTENANCSSVLGAGATCQITVIFKPIAAGNRSASISIADNAAGNPHSVALTGAATQTTVSLSPLSISFTNQLVGTASQPVAVTLTNSGTGALMTTSISFSGANPADFLEQDTCKSTIAPAAECTVNVTFRPAAVGARSANLVLGDNAANSPQSIPVTGAATNFAIDPPNVGATSATVTAGQTATYQLNLQSIDGFTGPVTLTCTGAPVGAACSVSPTPITLTANATAPFQVTVTTTARSLVATSDRTSPAMTITSALILSLLLLARPHHQLPQFRQLKHPYPRTQDSHQEFDDHITSRSLNRIPEILNSNLKTASTEVPPIPQANRSTTCTAAPTISRINLSPISLKTLRTISFKITSAAAVTTILLLLVASCGGGNSASQPSGTPPGTYTLTLTASSPSTPSPPTLNLALTTQ
jgi:hypothetical protein